MSDERTHESTSAIDDEAPAPRIPTGTLHAFAVYGDLRCLICRCTRQEARDRFFCNPPSAPRVR